MSVDLEATKQSLAELGDDVSLELPDGGHGGDRELRVRRVATRRGEADRAPERVSRRIEAACLDDEAAAVEAIPDDRGRAFGAQLQLRLGGPAAGGSSDVRGWDYRLLGPKLPDLRFVQEGDSLTLKADGYVPDGGLSRVSFSLELRLPLPGMGPNLGTHVFLDGGRVWTHDSRFDDGDDAFDQNRYFYGTGAGIDLLSPVGSIKVGLGYKLSPSILDLADSGDILRALLDDQPLETVDQRQSRRWAFYFALGSSF